MQPNVAKILSSAYQFVRENIRGFGLFIGGRFPKHRVGPERINECLVIRAHGYMAVAFFWMVIGVNSKEQEIAYYNTFKSCLGRNRREGTKEDFQCVGSVLLLLHGSSKAICVCPILR